MSGVRSDPPSPTVQAPRASSPASTLQLLPDPSEVPVDEIRARLKSANVQDAYQAVEQSLLLKDPAQRRELLLESVCSAHLQVRQRGMVALVQEIGDDALPVIQGILVSDPEPDVRQWAAGELGKLSDKGSTELLLNAYRTGDSGMKLAAAGSLYRFGTPGPAAELLPGLAADLDRPDGADRKDAVDRIGSLQAPIAIPLLTRALRDSSGAVRAKAASALGNIDAPEIPALLEPLLKDPWMDTRDEAKGALEAYRRRHPK